MKEKYSWLDESNKRKCMTDKEILDKYTDLDKSCLTDAEKIKVMECYINTKMH